MSGPQFHGYDHETGMVKTDYIRYVLDIADKHGDPEVPLGVFMLNLGTPEEAMTSWDAMPEERKAEIAEEIKRIKEGR